MVDQGTSFCPFVCVSGTDGFRVEDLLSAKALVFPPLLVCPGTQRSVVVSGLLKGRQSGYCVQAVRVLMLVFPCFWDLSHVSGPQSPEPFTCSCTSISSVGT